MSLLCHDDVIFIQKGEKGVRRIRNRTDFGGITWKRGRSTAKRKPACQAKMLNQLSGLHPVFQLGALNFIDSSVFHK